MSQEELAKEIKRYNEELIRTLMKTQDEKRSKEKNRDWAKNPILYIIVMALLAFILNYANNIFGSDIKILSNNFTNFKQTTESILKEHSNDIKSLKEGQGDIKTNVEILIDRDKSDWEKAVEKYNREKQFRGIYVDSVYSELLTENFNILKCNKEEMVLIY